MPVRTKCPDCNLYILTPQPKDRLERKVIEAAKALAKLWRERQLGRLTPLAQSLADAVEALEAEEE